MIQVIPKPESISWDDIHVLLFKSHEVNRLNGVYMRTANLEGKELKARVGNGQCFVAIADGVLVGTASAKIVERHEWYHRGEVVDFMLLGILPGYGGKGIFSKLLDCIYCFARSNNLSVVELDTAESNCRMRAIAERIGFQYVGIKASPYVTHYSVIMAYWLDGAPYGKYYMIIRNSISSFMYKLRYKRGRIKRFGI